MQSSLDEMKQFIADTDWYQKIPLSNGLTTPGRNDPSKRLRFLEGIDIEGRSVLDIGCNSGFYCLWAKKAGAARVVGVDIDERRIHQARRLAEFEGLDIDFEVQGISTLPSLGTFDLVLCFAVITEIQDVLGALEVLGQVTGEQTFLELALAKPLLYLSASRWLAFRRKAPSSKGILELRHTKNGWRARPSLKAIQDLLGTQFSVSSRGRGLKYDLVHIERA